MAGADTPDAASEDASAAADEQVKCFGVNECKGEINGFFVDVSTDRLYYTYNGDDEYSIRSCKLDGTDDKVVVMMPNSHA